MQITTQIRWWWWCTGILIITVDICEYFPNVKKQAQHYEKKKECTMKRAREREFVWFTSFSIVHILLLHSLTSLQKKGDLFTLHLKSFVALHSSYCRDKKSMVDDYDYCYYCCGWSRVETTTGKVSLNNHKNGVCSFINRQCEIFMCSILAHSIYFSRLWAWILFFRVAV